MKQRARIYYTETDKALMWDRWQKGESLNSIARHFDRHHSAIQGILSRTGGIRPPERRRSRLALTLAEREEISRGVVAGQSTRSIWVEHLRQSVVRSTVTAAGDATERAKPIRLPGIGRTARRPVNWRRTSR